jgi:hypothetical protein
MYKMKGRALAAIKKERKKKEKLSKGKWVKKRGGGTESEARYRPRRYSSTPPTIGGTVPSVLTSFPKRKGKF